MLWFLIALQAMAPFIHAHAGAVQLNHADFLHLHQGMQGDAAYHAVAANEHGAEFDVAQGRPLRIDPLGTANEVPPAMALSQHCTECVTHLGAGLPAPPEHQRVPPDHTHPHALAPPAV
jgi:hypothetical protein